MPAAWIENLLGVGDVLTAINEKRLWSSIDECGHEFISPWSPMGSHFDGSASLTRIAGDLATLLSGSNQIIRKADQSIRKSIAERISNELVDEVENSGWTEMPRPADKIENIADAIACGTDVRGFAENVIQYIVGVVHGRWDIRRHSETLEPVNGETVFAELPSSPRGMLQVSDLHQRQYPLPIISDGILVHDPEHPDDVERRVRAGIEAIWNVKAEEIEKELCQVLGVPTLHEYFRRSSGNGFWSLHVSRYSKSRRKSPIYWLLQSSKGNYALWLYYPRYDKDLLFKALVNYVEPKIRLEENRIEGTRKQLATVGQSGKEAKRVAKDLERQEDFLGELRDFDDKLRRAANLHLVPDLNDGVVLNIAPLHELVPWKEASSYWEELLAGKHEWSSIGRQVKQLRQKGLVR